MKEYLRRYRFQIPIALLGMGLFQLPGGWADWGLFILVIVVSMRWVEFEDD